MASVALVNGRGVSWSDLKLNILGYEPAGLVAINYKPGETAKEDKGGMGQYATERLVGMIKPELSLTWQLKELDRLKSATRAAGFSKLGFVPPFDFVLTYRTDERLVIVNFQYVEFTSEGDFAWQSTSMGIEVPVTMIVGQIVEEG